MEKQIRAEIESFLAAWELDALAMRPWFSRYFEALSALEMIELSFVARPGVSYSLRPRSTKEGARPLFAMVDVIDDEPAARWLSVCFYGEMITDPDEMGDFVPEGLLGEDAVCFDIEEKDDKFVQYVRARLDEACNNAAKE